MVGVSLEQAKTHLRVTHDAEDGDIQLKLDAATQLASNFLKRPIPWSEGEPPVLVEPPAAVCAAVLLILGSLYSNRESIITGTIVADNPAVSALLWPYRRLRFF